MSGTVPHILYRLLDRQRNGDSLMRGALLIVTALALAGLLVLPPSARAADPTTVRVAAYPYAGFFDIADDGTVSGFGYDYLTRLSSYTGWTLEFVTADEKGNPLTYADCLAMVEAGAADIASNVKETAETEKRFNFTERAPMEAYGTLTCRQDDNSMTNADWSTFSGKRIGILDNSARNDEIQKFLAEQGVTDVEFVRYPWSSELEAALIVTHEIDAIYNTNMRNSAGQKLLYCMNPEEYFFVLNKDADALTAGFNDALEKLSMEDPGFSEGLVKTWYPPATVALSLTAQEQDFIKRTSTITVAASPTLVPIEYYDETTGQFRGLTIEIYQMIAAKTGLQFSFMERRDAATHRQMVDEGSLQMLGTLASQHSVANEMGARLSSAVYTETFSLVYKNAHANDVSSDTLAIIENYPFFRSVAEANGYAHIDYYPGFEECIAAVDAGQADAALIPSSSNSAFLGHSYYSDLVVTPLEGTSQEFSLGVFKNAPDADILLSIINKALASIPADTIAQVRTQQILLAAPDQTMRDFVDSNLWTIVPVLLLVIALILITFAMRQNRNKRINALLGRTNEELQQAVDAKETAMVQANQASQAKTEFLSRVSHEVRTPMNAIIGLTSLMEGRVDDRDYIKKNLERVSMSSQFMLSLIDDILNISRIESGRMVLATEIVSMRGFVHSIESIIADRARDRGVRFAISGADQLAPYYQLDPIRLQQVIVNILGNAVKFTDPDGSVSLAIEVVDAPVASERDDQAWVRFTISDTGIGITPEFMPHLFEAFVREHTGSTSSYDGTGLGLAISNNIVTLMGGTIDVYSVRNQGSTFVVTVPLDIVDDARVADRFPDHGMPSDNATALEQTASRDFLGLHALLVDDNAINRLVAKLLLEEKGFVTTEAVDGKDALRQFAASKPGHFDVILMDVRMPKMDGLKATSSIRALERADARAIPIIAMTADAFGEDVNKVRDAGMDAHLAKPLIPAVLYKTLAQHCR